MQKVKLLFILTILFFSQCKKEVVEEAEIIEMYFKETKCSNPWEVLPENNNYLAEVEKYLEENGITIKSIEIKRVSDAPIYGGCSVLSGRRIYISTTESSVGKAENIGFIKIK